MFHSMRRLGLVAAGIAAGLTLLSGASQAATVSFFAFAFSNEGVLVSGDAVDIVPIVPLSADPVNEAIKIGYATSGLPYSVTGVEITATGTTQFFAPTASQPVVGPTTGGTSNTVGATITGVGVGNKLSATFANGTFAASGSDGDFQQVGSEVFYTGIANGSGTELVGHGTGPNLGLLEPPPPASPSWTFDGSHIKLTFTKWADAPAAFAGLPTTFTLEDNFGVITSPPYSALFPSTLNEARTGHSTDLVPSAVPEPGTLALFIGMGISGSGLLIRRRR
jgi:hypothetical protein